MALGHLLGRAWWLCCFLVSIVILEYLHIIEESHYLLLVISGLILFSSEQLLESDKQIREQATAIERVIENASPRLYALHDCVKDIDTTLPSIRPREKSRHPTSGFGCPAGMAVL